MVIVLENAFFKLDMLSTYNKLQNEKNPETQKEFFLSTSVAFIKKPFVLLFRVLKGFDSKIDGITTCNICTTTFSSNQLALELKICN